jgi:hypothetical protein
VTCSQLDEFFDGELTSADADAFRTHLATCERCQVALRGRMQEAMIVDEAEPAEARVVPIARARPRSRYVVMSAVVAVAAAAAVLALSLRGPGTEKPPQVALGVTLDIEHGAQVVRGATAHVGDRVHARATGALRIYRGDALVVACPGAPTCRPDGIDLELSTVGAYTFVVTASPATAVANLDDDLAGLVRSGAAYHLEKLDVAR